QIVQAFTEAATIKKIMKLTSKSFIDKLYGDLTATAKKFSNDLIGNSAPCTPVYQSYKDVGMLACEQMTGGMQGMWAAAGLAAIFFIPTIIGVFCVASALRGRKTTVSESEE
ncbi:hypothetical protein PENTCL1PPCAC_18745, partial [Pristionchus entomophagus]